MKEYELVKSSKIHSIIANNFFAFASNLVISSCCFLEMDRETFHHLVLDCKVVVVILVYILNYMK